ncbi:NAD-P-binding protein [Desarmillaria tabescens]|uniref:NAD-P-binding protein n=1 Tax=Armillaria tabescens TaxID=1929756 RepID=A0AA39TUK9_ARMTA|nr:NAD-P-binding protein [Desarmillaria tabescens]KAK0463964.1 NAD-P-binding protein [Desarmillaria tabescens]
MPAHKVWFITGANAGFGRSMLECAIRKGDKVVAAVRRPETMTKLQTEYTEDRLLVVKVDVSKPDEVNAAFDTVKKAFGRIDVVYNNAGYAIVGEVEGVPLKAARAVFETNFWAVAFFREVNQPQGGRLLQVSSMYGESADGCIGYYSGTKHAVNALTEALSKELDPAWNIKPTLIEAGYFKTDALRLKTFEVYEHPSYTNPAVEGVAIRQAFANFDPNNNPFIRGDPDKLSEVVYRVADMEDPPLWLPLGKDAYVRARAKIASYVAEIDKYESLSEDLEL